jgi:PEP-CTERM motif
MKKLLIITVALAASLPLFAQSLPLYVAGDFNGWNAAGNVMTETSPGSGIWQAVLNMSTGRHEFKVTEGDWSWNVPGSGNSWLYTDGSGNVTITYDTNTYSDGWTPTSGRIGVNIDPGTWTAVGDWQGWNNADVATAMSSIGGGIYELSYSIGAAGWYQYKVVDTGSWDAIGADSRSVNANTYWFQTTDPNQMVDFYVNPLNGTIKVDVEVPEPASMALMGLGGLALLAVRKRK